MYTVLLLEDDQDLRDEIREALEDDYVVLDCGSVTRFWQMYETSEPALIVLDLGLPDGRGSDVIRELRKRSQSVGIVVLSGQNSELERIVALEMGADDFVVKPCVPRELLARVKATIRRVDTKAPALNASTVARFWDYEVDLSTKAVVDPCGEALPLTSAEFEILKVLVDHPQQVLSRVDLVAYLRGDGWVGYDRSIDSLIYRLRKKFKSREGTSQIVKTVHGCGYLFAPQVTYIQ